MATSIRLTPEIEQRLNFLATSTGHTKAYYLREIIDSGLTDLEDYYLAAEVLERVRKNKEFVHSAADARKDLGLDDCKDPATVASVRERLAHPQRVKVSLDDL